MPATRNKINLSFGQVAITPVSTTTPTEQTATTIQVNLGEQSTQQQTVQLGATTVQVNATEQTVSQNSLQYRTFEQTPIQATPKINPVRALQGRTSLTQQNPVRIPTNNLLFEDQPQEIREATLPVERHRRKNGITIKTTTNIRPDLLAMTDFKSIYKTNEIGYTNFGVYLSELYKASVLRDTIRRYYFLNANQDTLSPILSNINNSIRSSISNTQNVITNLDQLINEFNDLKSVLNVKKALGSEQQTEPAAPLLKFSSFYTDRMLFSSEAYNSFSDTKLIYQLIADLTNIMSLCSFNLLDNFQDLERRQDPASAEPGSVVDPITIDSTYGTSLRYTPSSINGVYVTDYRQYNNIINVLPTENGNRIKFLINLLSKEFRVSYGLGSPNQLSTEKSFFGFGNSGNPFIAINGIVPSDIFLAPNGANGLASLFYQAIEGNAVVLPFEARQVAGDGETVFVPGIEYFGDGILNNNPINYRSYRDDFSTVYTNVQNTYNKLLLEQGQQVTMLLQTNLLKSVALSFQECQNQFRDNGVNSDSTSLLIYSLFLLGIGNTKLKYETYKLLLLLILYTERTVVNPVSVTTTTVNRYRQLILTELSSLGSNSVTEENLDSLLANQINFVRKLFEESILKTPNLNNTNATVTNYLRSQITVALEQFTALGDALKDARCGPNLFKSVNNFAKNLFNICSVNNQALHLNASSTTTRFNGLSMTGTLLLSYEIISCFVQQFSTDVVLNTQVENTQISNLNIEFKLDTQTVNDFLNETGTNNNILVSYNNKLIEEDDIVRNILEFFRLLNAGFSQVEIPVGTDISALKALDVQDISLGYIRTAKSTLKSFVDKMQAVNPSNIENFEFYIPSGKYVSTSNWLATKIALQNPKLRLSNKQKIVSVGIPRGFLDAALGARLSRNNVAGNSLNLDLSDLINVKIYKLGKNDDGLVYDPISYKFDMSLFSYGFDNAFPIIENAPSSDDTYQTLLNKFQFYDFDESVRYSQIYPKTLNGNQSQPSFLDTDPYYRERPVLGTEVVNNLYTSFILDNYLNTLTGLSFTEDCFVEYTQQEINSFKKAMTDYQSGNRTELANVKFMVEGYQSLLNFFTNNDEKKLMLTLCNDIAKTVLRPKLYDRTFHMIIDINDFPINIQETRKTEIGNSCLENLRTTNQTQERNGLLFRKNETFEISQYFINVEVIE